MSRRHTAAFTLLEMMVSVAILGLVTIYLTDMLVRQSRTYQVVDQVTEAQGSLRAIADLVEREVRSTGLMVPEAAAFCAIDRTNASDVIFVTDEDAIDPQDANRLGLGASIDTASYTGGSDDDLSLGTPEFGSDREVIDGFPFYDNDNDGVADADFLANDDLEQFGGVIIADRANPERGTACGLLTDVSDTALSVDYTVGGLVSPAELTVAAANTPELVAVPAHAYWVEDGVLFRNGLRLSDDVEDLQFAAFFDLDGDGEVTSEATEMPGSSAFQSATGPYDSSEWDHGELREIRVNLVVLTRAEDPQVVQNPDQAQGRFQVTENRVDPTSADTDGFRRRVHRVSIRPRNVGLRPDGV